MTEYTHFKCNQCGSDLDYAIGLHSLICVSCGHTDPIELSKFDVTQAHDYEQTLRSLVYFEPSSVQHELKCENCGADFVMPVDVHADECPYCDLNVVVPVEHKRQLQPDALIPFAVSQTQAESAFLKWIKGLWFAPNALKRKAIQAQGIVGSYVPLWLFDAMVDSDYRGERGDNYTTTVRVPTTVNGKRVMKARTVVKIRWRRCAGSVHNAFENVTVLGTQTLPLKFQRFLARWDLSVTQNYDERFLSGFRSQLYQVSLPAGLQAAKQVMDRQIRASVRRDIGGDHQRIHSINSVYYQVGYKLLLAPMWISAFNYNNKTYRYVINGQTGQAHGERPWSVVKIIFAVLSVAAVAGSIYLLSQQ